MIENLRRQAFIDVIQRSENQQIVVLFGGIPWEIFYAFDMVAINAYGIDYYVVEQERPICAQLNASLEYYRRDKCPFMHCASYFFVDNYCPLRREMIETHFQPVYVYENNDKLIESLEHITEQDLNSEKLNQIIERSANISQLLIQLEQSSLSNAEINQIRYYSKFILDLDQRIHYLKGLLEEHQTDRPPQRQYISLLQSGGIMHHFDDYIIREGSFCEGECHLIKIKSGADFIHAKYSRNRNSQDNPARVIKGCQLFQEVPWVSYQGQE